MTIAISLKVNDGVVLAADSATTILARLQNGQQGVANIYDNANKIFNLRKGLPLGATTWGAGSIGASSISTLMKDLRKRFSGDDANHLDWRLARGYNVAEVAARVRTFIYEEHYVDAFKDWNPKPVLGFVVAGYSHGLGMAEEYLIQVDEKGACAQPSPLRRLEESGVTWNGEVEAISRLVQGISPMAAMVLHQQLGVPQQDLPGILKVLTQHLALPIVMEAMPIQDAIDLAYFFVDLSKQFCRFRPGAPTVGGPIEIAAITKHEGFKWVRRKHYFHSELNPSNEDEEGML